MIRNVSQCRIGYPSVSIATIGSQDRFADAKLGRLMWRRLLIFAFSASMPGDGGGAQMNSLPCR